MSSYAVLTTLQSPIQSVGMKPPDSDLFAGETKSTLFTGAARRWLTAGEKKLPKRVVIGTVCGMSVSSGKMVTPLRLEELAICEETAASGAKCACGAGMAKARLSRTVSAAAAETSALQLGSNRVFMGLPFEGAEIGPASEAQTSGRRPGATLISLA